MLLLLCIDSSDSSDSIVSSDSSDSSDSSECHNVNVFSADKSLCGRNIQIWLIVLQYLLYKWPHIM